MQKNIPSKSSLIELAEFIFERFEEHNQEKLRMQNTGAIIEMRTIHDDTET